MRHLLDTDTLGKDAAIALLDTAAEFSGIQERKVQKLPTLRGVNGCQPVFRRLHPHQAVV